jgi:hypothetical protein
MWKGMRRSYFIQRWLLKYPSLADFAFTLTGKDGALARIFLEKL